MQGCVDLVSKGSLYSTTELIPVLGIQPAGDVSHKPGGRLRSLSARPAVTLATLRPLTGTKLYGLVIDDRAHVCERLAQGCCLKAERPRIEPATFQLQVQRPDHYTTTPYTHHSVITGS